MNKFELNQKVWTKPEFGNPFSRLPIEKIVIKVNTEESIDLNSTDMIGNHPINTEITYCLCDKDTNNSHYYPANKIFATRLECLESIREDYNNVVKEFDQEIIKEKELNDQARN